MRILIVGAGSTGGYFGARLAQAGRDVTFLVRPARAAALRETGLQVLSPLGDFRVEPRLVQAGAIERLFRRHRAEYGELVCLISGGAGKTVAPRLSIPYRYHDNLVLEGLYQISRCLDRA